MKSVEYLPEAKAEVREALFWYEEREPGIGTRLSDELLRAESFIVQNPSAGVPYLRNTRKWPLHIFPYMVVYRDEPERIVIVAVAHGSRRPGYWLSRLSG